MNIPAFNESEMEVVSVTPESLLRGELKNYRYPVSPKEAQKAAFSKHPYWQIIGVESQVFTPRIFPDNVARGFVFESKPFDAEKSGGGKDMFGVEWIYEPEAMGSMVMPGNPLFTDANEWEEKLVWPDVDSWDWEGSAQENRGHYLNNDLYNVAWIQNGFFERLISFMDFESAILALCDEDQQDAVTALLTRISDVYIDIISHFHHYFPEIDGFYIHDDWGSQKNTFFSPTVAEEMIVPHMRKVTDHIHSLGMLAECHSCGQNISQVPNYIKAGWDAWSPQPGVNNTREIHEKYGDQIMIGVLPDPVAEDASDEEKYNAGVAYANEFCKPERPSYLNVEGGGPFLSLPFREGLYRQSRINYSS